MSASRIRKVLIITYYWPPCGGAGVQRWLKFTKFLPQYGWQPVVLTVDPEYASYGQNDQTLLEEVDPDLLVYRTRTLEPYNLYKVFTFQKKIPVVGFSGNSKVSLSEKIARFIRGNLFIPDSRRGWIPFAVKQAKKVIDREKIDVVITTGPPHSSHLTGSRLKKTRNIKWIADFRDPWTDIYYYPDLFHSRMASFLDRRLEQKVISNCDHLITVSNSLGKLLQEKVSQPIDRKISIIPNGYDQDDFPESAMIYPGKFYITYTGTLAKSYHIDEFILAISELPDGIKENVVIRFVGIVPPEIIRNFHNAGLEHQLELIDYVPHKESVEYMLNSAVLLLAIPDLPKNELILTGKLFEYLAAGRPILCIGPVNGDAAAIISGTSSGVCVDYNDRAAMVQAITGYYKLFLENRLVLKNHQAEQYSRKSLTGLLSGILESLL